MSHLFLRLVWWALWPVVMLVTVTHPRLRGAWAERLMVRAPPVEPGAIWVHAASVGEGRAAEAIAEAIRRAKPGQVILRTAMTEAGHRSARGHDVLAAAPWDGCAEQFLRQVRPGVLVLVEAELWPLLLFAAAARKVPVIVAGARVGPGARRFKRLLPGLWAHTRDAVTVWLAKDAGEAEALRGLGVREVTVIGEPKADAPRPPPAFTWADEGRPLIIAASTRAGDEERVLRAMRALPGRPRLLVAPRQLQRVPEVAALLNASGVSWVARSKLGAEAPLGVDVVLLDTLGELNGLMALGDVAFVGGTFDASLGGHSPVEALAAGLPVVHGPAVWASGAAFEPGRCRVATDEATLVEALRWGLETPRRSPPAAEVTGGAADAVAAAALAVAAAALAAFPAAPPAEEPLRPWLWPLGALWSAITRARAHRVAPPPGAPPVISVGNLVSGGAGKTPVVAWLATRLTAQGERPVIVARGYGRAPGGPGVRTPKDGADATHLGDELAMLAARGLEVRSSPDRAAAIPSAPTATVMILDDGHQQALRPQLRLVVIDALWPLGGGPIPVGWAREGAEGLSRADVVWVMGEALPASVRDVVPAEATLVTARRVVVGWSHQGVHTAAGPVGEVVLLVGVARPGRVVSLVVSLGLRLRAVLTHPDHHPFTAADLAHATSFGLPVVTTEKDLTRLPPHPALWAVCVGLVVTSGEDALMARVNTLLGRSG